MESSREPIDTTGGYAKLEYESASPKAARTLYSRRTPLVEPDHQLAVLNALDLSGHASQGNFVKALSSAGFSPFTPGPLEIFQINIGKLCNMTCRHCHVDAGPDRIQENMDRETVDACLAALDQTSAHTVDITGGAPELNPHFRYLVNQCVARGKHVIDRCNLTVLLLPKLSDLPSWLAERGVEVVCSLPHYRKLNTDKQRGDGTYARSIKALRLLNEVGYGSGDPGRRLTLMHNPAGAFLPANQASMEREWKAALQRAHGVQFDRLIALNNMPISRYLEWLLETGNLDAYVDRLVTGFNPGTVEGLMCRNTLSISWDGRIFDCDFNQMLSLDTRVNDGNIMRIEAFDMSALAQREIVTDRHCYGCTAGSGSSCGGATA